MLLRNVFAKTIRDLRWPGFWTAVGSMAMVAYFAALFPTYKSMFNLDEMLNQLPPAMKAVMGVQIADMSTLIGFYHLELFSFMMPAIFIGFIAGIASGFTASEESRGTIDVLLSYPVRRWRVITDKSAALALVAGVISAATLVAAVLGAASSNSELPADRVAAGMLMVTLLAFAFAAMAVALAAYTGSRGISIGITLALAVAMYLVESLAELVDGLKAIRPLSFFHYYSANDPLKNGINAGDALVLSAVTAVFLVLALVAYERRDLAA